MNSFENIYSRIYLNAIHPLSSETREYIGEKMKSANYKKGQIICAPGDPYTKLSIIKRGLVRGFYKIYNREVTSWISIDDDIFTTVNYFKGAPAFEYIEALESTYVEYLELADMEEMLEKFHDFRILNRKLMETYFAFAEQRAFISRIPNAADRFDYFIHHYNKDIIKRSPKKHLASFLNMRPETLSRLIADT